MLPPPLPWQHVVNEYFRNSHRLPYHRPRSQLSLMSDDRCKSDYRLTRRQILFLTILLDDDLRRPTLRHGAYSVETIVLVALFYFASASFQRVSLNYNLVTLWSIQNKYNQNFLVIIRLLTRWVCGGVGGGVLGANFPFYVFLKPPGKFFNWHIRYGYKLQVIARTSPIMCQKGVSNCIQEFSNAINIRMNTFIWLPDNKDELDELSAITERLTGFPASALSVDGSLIPIMRPSGPRGNCYYSRKGFPAINAMICVDAAGIVRYVSTRFPGSAHDSYTFRQSTVSSFLTLHLQNVSQCKFFF